MLGLTHFVLGLAGGLTLFTGLTKRVSDTTVVIMSGFWALGPDIGLFIEELAWLEASIWSNVFWLHGLLDSIETGYPEAEALVACLFLLLTVAIVERH